MPPRPESVKFDVEAPSSYQAGEKYRDALLLTDFDPDDLRYDRDLTFAYDKTGKGVKFKPRARPLLDIVDELTEHLPGRKDGACYIPGDMVPGRRPKTAVKCVHALVADLDSGISRAEVEEVQRNQLGAYLTVAHSTFSHVTTRSTVLHSKVIAYLDKNAPDTAIDTALIRSYLRDEEKWTSELVDSAEYIENDMETRGRVCVVHHRPREKHRLIVFLDSPYDFTAEENGRTQAAAIKKYEELHKSFARFTGLYHDPACVDPSRLFYPPRHMEGKSFYCTLHGGDLFPLNTLLQADNPWDDIAAKLNKSAGGVKSVTPEGRALARWSKASAEGFLICDAIERHAPDIVRDQKASGLEITCPHDHLHSNPGDLDDRACLATNAGAGSAQVFTIKCQHAGCQLFTNLDQLGQMLAAKTLPEEVLWDPDFNTALVEVEKAVAELSPDALTDNDEASSPDTPTDKIESTVRKVLAATLDEIAERRKLDEIQATTKSPRREFTAMVKRLREAQRSEARRAADKAQHTPIDKRAIDALTVEFPPPPAAHGAFSYRGFGGAPWLHVDAGDRGLERLWTPWTITAGTVAMDREQQRGVRVQARNPDGAAVTFDMPKREAYGASGTAALQRLADAGVGLTEAGERMAVRLFREEATGDPIQVYDRAGWHDGFNISPWGTVVGTNRHVELASDKMPPGAEFAGTLAGWTEATKAAYASGVVQFQVAPLIAFGSVLTDLCGAESAFVAMTAKTSQGKSTAGKLMAAVSGDPSPRAGMFGPMNGTAASAEARLEMGSGSGYCFDELNLADGAQVFSLIYKGAGGGGNDRLDRSAKLKRSREWHGLYLLTGEHDIVRQLRSSGANATTGLGTRLLELNCDSTPVLSRKEMAKIEAAFEHHGHARRRFVQELIDFDLHREPEVMAKEIDALAVKLAGKAATPAELRAARIAATLWRAGEIAQDASLIPADEALGAGGLEAIILKFWTMTRDSALAPTNADEQAADTLYANLIRERCGRVVEGYPSEGGRGKADAWRLNNFDAGATVYVVALDALAEMGGGGLNAKALAKLLHDRGDLLLYTKGKERRPIWDYVKGIGKVKAVVIKAEAFEDDYRPPMIPAEALNDDDRDLGSSAAA